MKVKIGFRMVMTFIFLILTIIFIAPIGNGIVNIGNIFGALISVLFMTVSFFWGRFCGIVSRLWERPVGRGIVCLSGGLFGLCVILAVVISCFMIAEMNDKPNGKPTTLVVLGCQIKSDGPSLMLKRRLDSAYNYLIEYEDVFVVVSGGQGKDELTSEADVMRNYLVTKGISENRIFMEDKSVNTQENIRFSKEIIEREGLCSDITIVTDGFHQLRGDIFARREGLRAYNIPAPTAIWLLPTYWVREWFGIAYYTVFG